MTGEYCVFLLVLIIKMIIHSFKMLGLSLLKVDENILFRHEATVFVQKTVDKIVFIFL